MGALVNIVVGLWFLIEAAMIFGVAIPPQLFGTLTLIAALVVLAYPWLPRRD